MDPTLDLKETNNDWFFFHLQTNHYDWIVLWKSTSLRECLTRIDCFARINWQFGGKKTKFGGRGEGGMFCLFLSVPSCPTWVFALILFLSICFWNSILKIVELLPKANCKRRINVLSSSLVIECYETDINLLVFIDPFVLQLVQIRVLNRLDKCIYC